MQSVLALVNSRTTTTAAEVSDLLSIEVVPVLVWATASCPSGGAAWPQ
jgi:hypothetical protein